MKNANKLIQAIKAGNEDALYQVYKQYKGDFIKYAFKHHAFAKTDKDIIQNIYDDTILKFQQLVQNGKMEALITAKLSTYLLGIGKNLILDFFSKKKQLSSTKEVLQLVGSHSVDTPSSQLSIERKERRRILLKEVLPQIGAKCQRLLELDLFYNYTQESIQTTMGFNTANAVAQQKKRCLQKMLTLFGADRLKNLLSDD